MPTSVSVKFCKTNESLKQDLGPLTLGVICKLSRYISNLVLLMVESSCAELDHVCGRPCNLQGRDGCLTNCSKVRIGFFQQPFSHILNHTGSRSPG